MQFIYDKGFRLQMIFARRSKTRGKICIQKMTGFSLVGSSNWTIGFVASASTSQTDPEKGH